MKDWQKVYVLSSVFSSSYGGSDSCRMMTLNTNILLGPSLSTSELVDDIQNCSPRSEETELASPPPEFDSSIPYQIKTILDTNDLKSKLRAIILKKLQQINRVQVYQQQIDYYKCNYYQTRSSLASIQYQYEDLQASYSSLLSEVQQDTYTEDEQISPISFRPSSSIQSEDIQQLKNEKQQLLTQLNDLNRLLDDQRKQLCANSQSLAMKDRLIKALERSLKILETHSKKEKESFVQKCNHSQEQLVNEFLSKKEELEHKSKDEEIKHKNEIEELIEKYTQELNDSKQMCEGKISELKIHYEELMKKKELEYETKMNSVQADYEKKCSDYETQISSLQADYETKLEEEKRRAQQEAENQKNSLHTLNERVKSLEKELNSTKKTLTQVTESYDLLKTEYKDFKENSQIIKNQLESQNKPNSDYINKTIKM